MNNFKVGDKVQRVHHIAGIFPNGKYKVVSGMQSSVVDEKELILVEKSHSFEAEIDKDLAKKFSLGVLLAVLGVFNSIYFNSPVVAVSFGVLLLILAKK